MFEQHYGTTVMNEYKTFKYSCTGIQNVKHRMVYHVSASACLKAGLALLKEKENKKKKQKTDLDFAEGNH